jgi:Co/Zn/Cd efflux system component
MILCAAMAVALQIGWRVFHPEVPIVETMGMAAVVNLAANSICLYLLTPFKGGDVNMSSAWECSRNDVIEGTAVILTAIAVALIGSAWPDIIVAIVLLAVFLRSAIRVLRSAWGALSRPPSPARV